GELADQAGGEILVVAPVSTVDKESDPRRRCGEAGPPSPLRFGAAEPGASIGRRPRRLIGAPTAPPPPRCAIRPRARAARLSLARREQTGDGLSSLHVPRRDAGARRMEPRLRRLNLARLPRGADP